MDYEYINEQWVFDISRPAGPLSFVYADGGRSNYFKADNVGDCVCRAICNATGMDYMEVYKNLNACAKKRSEVRRSHKRGSSRNGLYKSDYKGYIASLGWKWHPTMQIGSGCTIHLRKEDLPEGTLIVSVSRHLTCVKDHVLYDTYDCSRDGDRCVYGYWTKE